MVRIAEELIEGLKDKNTFDIYNDLTKMSSKIKSYKTISSENREKLNLINELIYLVRNCKKPDLISDNNLLVIKPLVENLIENGHMSTDILNIFDSNN